jgi:hypothetical protein
MALSTVLAAMLFVLMYWMASADYALTEAFDVLFKGGEIRYQPPAIREYAETSYDTYFAGDRHEDNLLVVILPREDGVYQYDIMAVGGEHLDEDVMEYFGELPDVWGDPDSEITEARPLAIRLADSIRGMGRGLTKSFTSPSYWGSPLDCKEEGGEPKAQLINETKLPIDVDKVEPALKKFAENTDIGLVVIVADQDDVFDRYFPDEVIHTFLMLGAALMVAAAVIVVVALNWKKWVPEKAEAEPEETAEDHQKLDDDYWKDRY